MYKLTRDIHLGLGLFCLVFLVGYALSAAQMAYPIYRPQPRITRTSIQVPADVDTTPRPLAKWLMDHQDLRGDLVHVATTSRSVDLKIVRPATKHDVKLDLTTRTAEVTSARLNAVGMMNRIHHVGGVWHDYWAINAWGWFLLFVSLSLIVIALTGIYMWFKRHRERKIGAALLTFGLVWGGTLLVLIRFA